MGVAIDPARRALPISEWPQVDRDAWKAALTQVDILDDSDGGGAVHWAARTRLTNIQHYGRWLGYLKWRGLLGDQGQPGDRVTWDRVREYVTCLEAIVAPRTRLSMLVGLKVMMKAMAPATDWGWLQKVCNQLQRTATPSSNKLSRMRPTSKIVSAAIRELKRLPSDPLSKTDALFYRDALMLALLASRPLRVKNFSALELGKHLVKAGDSWLLPGSNW